MLGLSAQRLSSCRLAMRYREGLATSVNVTTEVVTLERGAVSPEAAVSGIFVRTFCESWSGVSLSVRSRARIDRSLYGACRARPSRCSHALGHDELGHLGLTAALEKSSGSAWERFRR